MKFGNYTVFLLDQPIVTKHVLPGPRCEVSANWCEVSAKVRPYEAHELTKQHAAESEAILNERGHCLESELAKELVWSQFGTKCVARLAVFLGVSHTRRDLGQPMEIRFRLLPYCDEAGVMRWFSFTDLVGRA